MHDSHEHMHTHEHEHPHTHEHEHPHTHDNGETHTHAHNHEHCHEHQHEHEHTHDHPHEHEHLHDHGHSHDHAHEHLHDRDHPHHHDHGSAEVSPKDELVALMKYMVGHNAAHAEELAALAGKVQQLGDTSAYDRIMHAVDMFRHGNAHLAEVLEDMQ